MKYKIKICYSVLRNHISVTVLSHTIRGVMFVVSMQCQWLFQIVPKLYQMRKYYIEKNCIQCTEYCISRRSKTVLRFMNYKHETRAL